MLPCVTFFSSSYILYIIIIPSGCSEIPTQFRLYDIVCVMCIITHPIIVTKLIYESMIYWPYIYLTLIDFLPIVYNIVYVFFKGKRFFFFYAVMGLCNNVFLFSNVKSFPVFFYMCRKYSR